jgi:hypothetical protein
VRALVVALALCACGSASAEMPRTAFWMDLRVGGGASLEGGFFPTPAIIVGARLVGRLQLGGGVSYWRFGASGTTTIATVLAQPDLAVDLFKSRDERVALYLGLSIPMGALLDSDHHFAVGYRIAFGVRYSPHPNFGMGVEAGGQGLFYRPGDSNGWSNIQSIYAALVGTFYAGRRNETRVQPPAPANVPPSGAAPPR